MKDEGAVFNRLIQDYADTNIEMAHAMRDLAEARGALYSQKRKVSAVEEAMKVYCDRLVLGAMEEGGCINGKNAEIRQLQATDFLSRRGVEDAALVELRRKLAEAKVEMDRIIVQHDNSLDRLTVARNRARMIAGLGEALGG